MSVLKGEGTMSILYGSTRLPLGRNLPAYLSRPDASGGHPTVIVAHGASGVGSHAKGVCRRLARHGFAVICPEIAPERLRADVFDAYETAALEGTEWSDETRVVLFALNEGAAAAIAVAPDIPGLAGLVAVGRSARSLAEGDHHIPADALVIVGGADTPGDVVAAGRRRLPRSEWVVYRERGSDFFDDAAADFDQETTKDAWRRVLGFLERVTAG